MVLLTLVSAAITIYDTERDPLQADESHTAQKILLFRVPPTSATMDVIDNPSVAAGGRRHLVLQMTALQPDGAPLYT